MIKKKVTTILLSTFMIISTLAFAVTTVKANVSNGWQQNGATWNYYVNGNKETGWIKYNNTWYYLESNGAMKIGWLSYNNNWYYLESNGAMRTSGDVGGWTINANGIATKPVEVKKGWNINEKGLWSFNNEQGKKSKGWIKDLNSWYYLDEQGDMKTGWLAYNNTWYYLNQGGGMETGWISNNGKSYYLNTDGDMVVNTTTPDGYVVETDGAWNGQANTDSSTIVTFKDKNLEKLVRDTIDKPIGDICKDDVNKITTLYGTNSNINNLSGIENLVNLKKLYLQYNEIRDINPIVNLKLTTVLLEHNNITADSNSNLIHLYNTVQDKDFQIDSKGNAVFIVRSNDDLDWYVRYNGPFIIKDDKMNIVYKKAQQVLNSIIKPNMDDFEKEKAIHDYIVLNTKYDYDNYLKNTIPEDSYLAYGILINHIGVCSGYADATNLLLNMTGIESKVLSSDKMNHAWNIVKIYGEYYHLDVTWDDPIPDTAGVVRYNYFNKTDNGMWEHSWDNNEYPVCNSTSIEKVESLNIIVYQGDIFSLPNTIEALMVDNSFQQVLVKWNNSKVDTNKIGSYTFEGTIQGYSKKVYVNITIQ